MRNLPGIWGVFIIFFAVASTVVGQDLEAGLVGYYKMDEGEGAFTANSATGDNIAPDGLLFNDPVWGEGVDGSALWFTSAGNNYVWLDTYDPSGETGKLSISVWTNWQGGDGGWHGICGKRDAWDPTAIKWSMVLDNSSGGVQFETNTADSGKVFVITPTAPLVGEWQHIAVTFDSAWAIFYMDGAMVSEGPMVFGLNDFASLHFGCGTANGTDTFSGGLDELRFYNRVLTEDEVYILATETPTSVDGPSTAVIEDFRLHQNYPNPFNPTTAIRYQLKKTGFVTLRIYNTLGEELHSLVNAVQTSGAHSVTFDAGYLAGGVYFYALEVGGRLIESRKMLLLK